MQTQTQPVDISSKHRVIVAPCRADIQNLFPTAKPFRRVTNGSATDCLVIPHGPYETRTLRTLGFDVPAPIASHYEWPGANKPFAVQIKTCALLTTSPRAYVLNGMGTGKTSAALWAWDYLNRFGYARKLLVVAPLSTLNFTWAKEVMQTLPHRVCTVLYGSAQKRKNLLAKSDADIFVVNHDGLRVIRKSIGDDIDSLVIDELAVYRNPTAVRSKEMRDLVNAIVQLPNGRKRHRLRWVWGMTGSPTPNEPTDVWAQASILTPDRVPKYFTRFREQLMYKSGPFRWLQKDGAVERAYEALQPAVRFTLDDVAELPDCIERQVDIELSEQQQQIYKSMKNSALALVQQNKIDAMNAGAVLNKLLQISCGWVYTREGNTVPLDNNARLERLVEDIESTDRKVLVFVPFTHALQGIADHLRKHSIEVATIDGSTPKGQRDETFRRFQSSAMNSDDSSPVLKVIVAHPQTMAHGLTLTEANTVIWFAPIPSLEIFEQANARIRRVGQKHKQLVLMYQSTDAERKLYARLRAKQKVQDMILSLFEESSE